jgi:G3E family GTPase
VIPFVILTGFLGSGKTTLLNQLLADRQREAEASGRPAPKLGLIVNELGEIGVDGELLPQSATRQIELPGGCVCCVLSDDLATTVVDMLAATPELEAILLETTGVAEPLPLSWALERPPLDELVRLAAVVTLVDATTFVASRALSPAVDAQVSYADVLLLTKGELAGAEALAATTAAAHELAPRAELHPGTTARHAAWLRALLADPPLPGHPEPRDPPPGATCAPDCGDPDHSHHIHRAPAASPGHLLDSAATYLPDRVVDLEELEDQLAELPPSYVRIKGIIRAVDGRRACSEVAWYAFHRVGLRVSSEPLGHPSSARVVALGTGVEIDRVKACIESALVS